jgi:FkbM family methyltransferase
MIKQKLKKGWLLLNDSRLRKKYLEINRIKKMPRYEASTTFLLGKELHFVDSSTFLSTYYEIFEEKILKFKSSKLNPFIIDCGANIGLITIFFKLKYPEAKIICFEPNPYIFATLKQNIDSFKFDDVELHQSAVWNKNGEIDFHLEGGHSSRIPKDGETLEVTKVKTIDLKNYLTERVDLLKIDIEGAEYTVIKNIQEELKLVDNLFLEYHSHVMEDQKLGEILTILNSGGFRYHIQPQYHSKQPFIKREEMLGMDFQINIFAFR